MKSGPKQKGRQQPPPGGDRSGNHRNMTNVAPVKMKGKAESATQGRTRNHPNVAPTPKAEIGKGVPNSYFANSRSPVHRNFDTKGKHD